MEEQKYKISTPIFIIREIIVILLWTYIILKLCVFDIDNYLIYKYLPSFSWLLEYKIIIILTFFVVFLFTNKVFRNRTIFYTIFYPFIILFWKIPKLIFKTKNWILAFGSINIIANYFKNFKINLLIFLILILSIVLIIKSQSTFVIITAMTILFIYLIYIYIVKLITIFNPSRLFFVESQSLKNKWNEYKDKFLLKSENKPIDFIQLAEEDKNKLSFNLQYIVSLNRIIYFVASKLKSFQRSKLAILYFIVSFIFTITITIIIFGVLNYGLYKIIPSDFTTSSEKGLLYFIYYSFCSLFTVSAYDLQATGVYSILLFVIEIALGIILTLIYLGLIFTVQNEKYNENLNNIIGTLEFQGKEIDIFIGNEFNLSIKDAIEEIEKLKGIFIKFIYYLTKNIN